MIPKTTYTSYQQLRKKHEKHNNNGNVALQQTKISSRPSTTGEKPEIDYDISPEFLDTIQSITNRDFEHATNTNSAGENSTTGARRNRALQRTRSPRRPSGTGNSRVDGFQLFANSSQSRPSTVPRYLGPGRNVVMGDGPNKIEGNKNGPNVSTYYYKSKALMKSKVTPSQLVADNDTRRKNSRSRPISANSSDSSFFMSDTEERRPSSANKRVTFAADTVNYERENKPARKRKMPKRRRQGFPHPSRGIFIPPDLEIVESTGPNGSCRENPYLCFNQVWTHPAARATGESAAGKLVRTERFHRLMHDLEHAHIQYNRLATANQNEFLTKCIFKRYILVLDLALTEGHIAQVEHLLDTIQKSIPVLHQSVFYYLYGAKAKNHNNSNNKKDKNKDENNNDIDNQDGESVDDKGMGSDLTVVSYALEKICGDQPRHDLSRMSIETILVKLLFELLEVVYAPYGSLVFRDSLTNLPHTVRQAIVQMKNIRSKKESFCYIKWINNSPVQRDFRSTLKNLGLLDRYGCKADIPGIDILPAGFVTGGKPKKSNSNPNHNSGGVVKSKLKGMGLLANNVSDKRGRVSTS